VWACSDVINSIRPLILRACICAPAACPRTKPARNPTVTIESHSDSVTARAVSFSRRLGDALCTRIETNPSDFSAASNSLRGAVGSARSAGMKVAFISRARARPASTATSLRTGRTPSATSAFAIPRPMPDAAPVISAVSPSSNGILPSPELTETCKRLPMNK